MLKLFRVKLGLGAFPFFFMFLHMQLTVSKPCVAFAERSRELRGRLPDPGRVIAHANSAVRCSTVACT